MLLCRIPITLAQLLQEFRDCEVSGQVRCSSCKEVYFWSSIPALLWRPNEFQDGKLGILERPFFCEIFLQISLLALRVIHHHFIVSVHYHAPRGLDDDEQWLVTFLWIRCECSWVSPSKTERRRK